MAHPNFILNDPSLLTSTGWINGLPHRSVSGRAPFDLVDPATGKKWHQMEDMTVEDTDLAIAAADRAFQAWSTMPARSRGRILMALDNLYNAAQKDLAMLTVMETGKALSEAAGEVSQGLSYSFLAAGEAERLQGETVRGAEVPGMRYFTIREAIGPVALLCPWNFPVLLPFRKLVLALAAGCTVVLKPSPETPTTSVALAILCKRAGVPDGVVNVVSASTETTPAVGKKLCEDRRIKKIHFTGSTAIGKLLMAQCASSLKKMTLELGGNGAFVVFEDANLERAATLLLANKFRNAGQVCVCANRVYVQRPIFERFAEAMKTKLDTLKLPMNYTGITTGSLTTRRGAEHCSTLVEDAIKNGSTVLRGGKRVGPGYHFEPTLLVGAGPESMVHTTEMFSPILSLYPFDTEEEVLRLANNTDMGLTNYVFTQDISRAWRCFEAMKSGQVAINNGNATAAEVPFGGIKESGMGKEGGYKYGIEEFCVVRSAALML